MILIIGRVVDFLKFQEYGCPEKGSEKWFTVTPGSKRIKTKTALPSSEKISLILTFKKISIKNEGGKYVL